MLAKTETVITHNQWLERAETIAAEIAGHAAAHDRDDTFVEEGFAALKREGFFTALVPTEFGGGGASMATICECIRLLARGCSATALAFAMHSHVVAVAAWRYSEMKAPTEGLLKRVVADDLVLVSSGGGDWLASGGTAEKVDGGYRVTARKPFASGSAMGDLLNTSAVYNDPQAGPTVLHFAVLLKAEGVRIEQTWQVMGMRGTGSNDVVLEGVFVPDGALGGSRPAGPWHPLFHIISKMAFAFIYSAYLGIAEAARDLALEAAKTRTPNTLSALQAGEMDNALMLARLANAEAIAIAENATPGPQSTSAAMQCRQLTGQYAIATVEKAMELAGGSAFYRRNALERLFRDVQAARFHPLTSGPQLELTGRVALGWPID